MASTARRVVRVTIAFVALGLLALSLATPQAASAHERRKIADGKVEVVVGWVGEPAYLDQPNGVDFRVTDVATGKPVEGLEKTVKVDVIKGGSVRTFDLRTRFGMPGAYMADVVPTKAGDYQFRFHGEINGAKVDDKFESGPGRFADIRALTELQFPVTEPSIGELQAGLAEARAASAQAQALAIGGGAVGVIGLAIGVLAIRRRSAAARSS